MKNLYQSSLCSPADPDYGLLGIPQHGMAVAFGLTRSAVSLDCSLPEIQAFPEMVTEKV